MFVEYADCEILVQPCRDNVFPIAIRAPGGEGQGTLRLPTNDPDYQMLMERLIAFDTDEDLLSRMGQVLFNSIFQGHIKDVYERTQGTLKDGQGLRIRINIADESDVAALPWEFLYDPDQAGPMALLDMPIVRYRPLQAKIRPLSTSLPLKVLLTGAETPPSIDVTRELETIKTAMETLGAYVQITVEPHLTVSKLRRLLREGFHIWHFVGHAGIGRDGKTSELYFEDEGGNTNPVDEHQLYVHLHRSVQLIVLNICQRGRFTVDWFRSIAPRLIDAQIPAVVAMQFSISEDVARAFASEFYRAVAEGFPLDACVTEGRKAVMNLAGLGRPDWGIPVVYTHAPDGKLFEQPSVVGKIGATINHIAGTILHDGISPTITRHTAIPRPPPALHDFRDRAAALNLLRHELQQPGSGIWLHGPRGCGCTALLRQAANDPELSASPHGVAYVDGKVEPQYRDDVVQRLFQRFYVSSVGVHITPSMARTYLGDLKALFVLDQLPLRPTELAELRDMLASGTVLICSEGAAHDTLLDLPLGGLPRQDAMALCMAAAGIDSIQPTAMPPRTEPVGAPGYVQPFNISKSDIELLIDRLCTALDDLPLPVLLAGYLLRRDMAQLPHLVTSLEQMQSEPEPLVRAALLSLNALNADERTTLAAVVRASGSDVDLTALSVISQIPIATLEHVLPRLVSLGLVESNAHRYAMTSSSLRHILDQLLPPGDERQRTAAHFATAAAEHIGDLAWLEHEYCNLFAAIENSVEKDQMERVRTLARAVQPFLLTAGLWDSCTKVIDWAKQAAEALGDQHLEAWCLHERGTLSALQDNHFDAIAHLEQAQRLRLELGDEVGAMASGQNLLYLNALLSPPPGPLFPPTWPSLPLPGPPPPLPLPLALPLWRLLATGARSTLQVSLVILLRLAQGLGLFTRAVWNVLRMLLTGVLHLPPILSVAVLFVIGVVIAIVFLRGVAPWQEPPPSPTREPQSSHTPLSITEPPAPTTQKEPSQCTVVAVPSVNLRSGPGTIYKRRPTPLPNGTVLTPLERNADKTWIKVQVTGENTTGWVSADPDLVVCTIAIVALPLGEIPTPPVQQPPPVRPASPVPHPTPVPPTPIPPTRDGPWSGKTEQEHPISFLVQGDSVTSISFSVTLNSACPVREVSFGSIGAAHIFWDPDNSFSTAIDENDANAIIEGAFTSATTADGKLMIYPRRDIDHLSCPNQIIIRWHASK